MTSESTIQKRCRLRLSQLGAKLFRVNVGRAWTGEEIIRLKNGDLLIKNPRPFHAGVPKGYPDLTGWVERNGVAVFTAIEVKSAKGRVTPEQLNFLEVVQRAGGIARVVRSEEDCEEAIRCPTK